MTTTAPALTKHQQRILVALLWYDKSQRWLTRYSIGLKVGNYGGAHLKSMLKLFDLGLVQYESEDALRLVREEVCQCGCDRWRLTDAGRALARTYNVVKVEGTGGMLP